ENPHLAGEAPRVRCEVLLQALRLRQDSPRMLQQGAAGRCRCDTRAPAHQKGGPECQFHLPNPGRGSRKCQIGACRPVGDAPSLNDMPEQVEVGKIEPHSWTSFLFCEGRLHIKHIAMGSLWVQASRNM